MKQRIAAQVLVLVLFLLGAFTACASSHWSYAGESGPENWASLDAKNSACSEGQRQSPIDIQAPFKNVKADLKLSYGPSQAEVVNNGHTIQVNLSGENTLQSGGKTYRLLQFHFHSPSEEAVNGKRYAMVAHLVHASDAGELAVIGVLIQTGRASAALAPVFDSLPAKAGEKRALAASFNPKQLLPASLTHWNFDGSLTTPPCSEGVNWFVLKTPTSVSTEQLAAFDALYANSARPLQARNDREIRLAR